MALKDRYKGASAPAETSEAPTPEISLAAMREKLKAGKTGGVNPPEGAEVPLSVAPKTGPNGESLTEAAAAVAPEPTPEPSAPAAGAKRGRKPKAAASGVEQSEGTTSFGSFLTLVEELRNALPAGVSVTIVGGE